MDMPVIFKMVDPYLIWLYRITHHGWLDFFLGTFVLALMAVIIGEFTIALVFLAARHRIEQTTGDAVRYQNMSVDALAARDKQAYSAANKLANDAFGHTFFHQIAMSAAFLWPLPFVLAWMQYRFLEVDFPIPWTGYSVNYIAMFLLVYVVAYFLFKQVKYKIPFFRRIKVILDNYKNTTSEMKTLADLHPLENPKKT
ncbi:MAG: hypothetical protein P8168_06145 [Deltaproteobacteria bacterium]|jgi:hypothetical protein